MSRIATALAVKYGKPDKLHDYCSGDVICEGRFWDYALNNGSRTHAYQWQNPKAKTVRAIALEALGSDLGPYIRLTYELGNAKACEAREAQMGAQNL
jgi:hypothetical protein